MAIYWYVGTQDIGIYYVGSRHVAGMVYMANSYIDLWVCNCEKSLSRNYVAGYDTWPQQANW